MGEKEMRNKLMLGVLLISVVFISGCAQQGGGGGIFPSDKPFIKEIKITPDYIYQNQNEKAKLDFTISNPLQITFTGYTELRIDVTNCVASFNEKKDIAVPAKGSMPFSIDLTPSGTQESCLGSRQITLVLNDVNDVVMDYETIQLNIVQR